MHEATDNFLAQAGMKRFVRSSDRPVEIGIVGLGYWGPNLLRVLVDSERANVRWICDLDEAALDRYARRYPGVQTTENFDDLLDDSELDAVFIATPVFTHHELGMRSIWAGKHTFVEKPLAASSEEAGELLEAATDRDLVLMGGHTFLYSPPVRAIKRMLAEDELGQLFFISSSRVNLGLHQRDVSVIWDLGPHDFSILLYWLDQMPVSVRAIGRDSVVAGIPDVAFITLRFESGLIVNIELSWLAPSKLRRTVVVGSDKMVVYNDGAPEPIRVFDHGVIYEDPATFGEYHLSYRTGDITSPKLDSSEPLVAQIDDFLTKVRSETRDNTHCELACNVVTLIEAAEESMNDGGVEIELAPGVLA